MLLLGRPAYAQRSTAEAAQPAAPFWSIDATTGTVVFRSPTVRPLAPALALGEGLTLNAYLTPFLNDIAAGQLACPTTPPPVSRRRREGVIKEAPASEVGA